jgi:excisionase family DNA binding protein
VITRKDGSQASSRLSLLLITEETVMGRGDNQASKCAREDPTRSLVFTVAQTAELLGLGRNQTYEAVQRGDIPSIRIGKRILVPRFALENMLAGRK